MRSSDAIRLVVNADDFGFTPDVNEGIVKAHREGILTATTMMANGTAFDHAVSLARANPTLDIGCHLVFVQGPSVLDPERALPATLKNLVIAVARRRVPLYEEAAAQVRKIIAAGIQPSHIDTHKHTHFLPPVLEAVARVARDFNIPWVRKPFDYAIDPSAPIAKRLTTATMRLMKPLFARALGGLRTTDHFTGFQRTGTLTTENLVANLRTLPPGLTELMCHPGILGAELRSAPTRLKQSRAIELEALLSPLTRQLIEDRGIRLVTYRQLTD